jgi:hypothetical protein
MSRAQTNINNLGSQLELTLSISDPLISYKAKEVKKFWKEISKVNILFSVYTTTVPILDHYF